MVADGCRKKAVKDITDETVEWKDVACTFGNASVETLNNSRHMYHM